MTIKARIINIENYLLRMRGLLGGHQFQVRYVHVTDSFLVVFEKMAHSTLTKLNAVLLEREVTHIVVSVKNMDDDYYPAGKDTKKKKRRKRKRIKPELKQEINAKDQGI
jgi:hypothetical protein